MVLSDIICTACGSAEIDRYIDPSAYPACQQCGSPTERLWSFGKAAEVRQDSIPGGVWIHHGLCNADGSPRRFDSHAEIREASAARGLIPWTDVHTEDRTKDARVYMDWSRSAEAQKQKAERREMRRAGLRVDPIPVPQSNPAERERTARVAREVVGSRSVSEARERAERVAKDVYRR